MKVSSMMSMKSACQIIVLMFFALTAKAGAAVAKAGNSKYAIVDMQQVILNVDEGKKARTELEKEIKAKEKDLLKQREELDKMNQEWKDQAALLSEQARMKKQQDFQEKFLALRNEEMNFQNEIKRKEQMATQKIAISVTKIVNQLAEQKGFEMVFETNSAGLLYLNNPVDLTQDVIKSYEVESKKGEGNSAKK